MVLEIRTAINAFYSFILDSIYPPTCRICRKNFISRNELICNACGDLLEETSRRNWISELTFSAGLDEVYSGWYFNNEIQYLIHSLKYSDSAKLGASLGSELGRMFEKVGRQLDLLTAVPLHSVKKRSRGYNQAAWVTQGLSKELGVPYDFNILRRTKATVSQTTLSSQERYKNMQEAFKAEKELNGISVGIVDDVLTTGATVSAAGTVLKTAGATKIIAISCATPKISN